MSRFIIVTTPGTAAPPSVAFAEPSDRRPPEATGCAWLFSAAAGVDDPEAAMRAAVAEFFCSPEGDQVRQGERLDRLGWCDAIPWIPDETWQHHGLTVFRHPDVERILLDDDEDLAEDLPPASRGESTAARRRMASA